MIGIKDQCFGVEVEIDVYKRQPREGADLKKYLPRLCAKHPEWDGQTRWNLQLKEIRDLIHAGKDYDRHQTSNKKKRSRGGEAR